MADVIFAFHDSKNTNNQLAHKDAYINFSMSVLLMLTGTQAQSLYHLLESQYVQDSYDQYPMINGKTYWIRVV